MRAQKFNLSLLNLIYRLRKFRDILREELDDIMLSDKVASALIECIHEQLYQQGINGKGEFIMDYQPYRPKTIKKKRRKGQPYDRVTLHDKGDFYRSMKLQRIAGGFGVVASDDSVKVDKLLKRYKPTILRLTNENLNWLLQELVRPELVRRLKQRLNED